MDEKSVSTIIKIGFCLVAISTPIWLPHLLGIKIKECEYGLKPLDNQLVPYCKCRYD